MIFYKRSLVIDYFFPSFSFCHLSHFILLTSSFEYFPVIPRSTSKSLCRFSCPKDTPNSSFLSTSDVLSLTPRVCLNSPLKSKQHCFFFNFLHLIHASVFTHSHPTDYYLMLPSYIPPMPTCSLLSFQNKNNIQRTVQTQAGAGGVAPVNLILCKSVCSNMDPGRDGTCCGGNTVYRVIGYPLIVSDSLYIFPHTEGIIFTEQPIFLSLILSLWLGFAVLMPF